MEDYEAKFCYLYRHTKPGPVDCDFKATIKAVSQADANEQATVIAQTQIKPAYVMSVEPKVRKRNYGDAACFRHEYGAKMKVRRLSGLKGENFRLTLEEPQREEVAIILDSDAWEALCQWRKDSETGYEIGAAETIVAVVAKKHKVRSQDIQSNNKTQALNLARREALYRVRKETNLTVVKIGDLFNVDQATVSKAVRLYEEELAGRKARKVSV